MLFSSYGWFKPPWELLYNRNVTPGTLKAVRVALVEPVACFKSLSQAKDSGLILAARVGKHTDELIEELITSTEGKTDCQHWDTDGWGGYERVLPPGVQHHVGKDQTQCLERTNGVLRQQTGRWHRQQNKFGKKWEQTKVTTRLVVSYLNWMWEHSRLGNTAALVCRFSLKFLVLACLCYLSHTSRIHDHPELEKISKDSKAYPAKCSALNW